MGSLPWLTNLRCQPCGPPSEPSAASVPRSAATGVAFLFERSGGECMICGDLLGSDLSISNVAHARNQPDGYANNDPRILAQKEKVAGPTIAAILTEAYRRTRIDLPAPPS